MATQTNLQILEAILKRDLQCEQIEEINNLNPLNSYCPKNPDRVFLLDEDETPNLVGYIAPSEIEREDIQELIQDSTLIWNLLGVKIYKI